MKFKINKNRVKKYMILYINMMWHIYLYRFLNLALVILTVTGYFSLSNKEQKDRKELLLTIHRIIVIFLGTTLFIVFNPIYKIKTTSFHREIGFSSGIFIITSSALIIYIDKMLSNTVKIDIKKVYTDDKIFSDTKKVYNLFND
jgi:hypothetical protein